ncbi:phosphatidylglycerol lysyltransferase domain-containing protein [Candidatus Woesearchaeota archaeon]|nr:phosphatidylglycerol lysyltransferase domain-containing protein [Candidatus Woesearchaeota archaeon]
MRNIEFSDRELFSSYLSKYPSRISEMTFTNLFAWAEKYSFTEEDKHLIIKYGDQYMQPIGPRPADKIVKMVLNGKKFHNVDGDLIKNIDGSGLIVKKQRDEFDYVYDIKELATLKGGKYVPKRNFVKRFAKNHPCVCMDLSKVLDKCLELQEEWCNMRDCDKNPALAVENRAIRKTLTNFTALELFGVALLVDRKVVGFAIGEPLNHDTFVEHFEKGDTNYDGVYQYLLKEFASRIPDKFKYLNREQDLGIEGIRKAKKSYYPAFMVEKYNVEGD